MNPIESGLCPLSHQHKTVADIIYDSIIIGRLFETIEINVEKNPTNTPRRLN